MQKGEGMGRGDGAAERGEKATSGPEKGAPETVGKSETSARLRRSVEERKSSVLGLEE